MSIWSAASIFDIPLEDWQWRKKAACVDVDPGVFFPKVSHNQAVYHHNEIPVVLVREAQQHCRGCPVREECLDYALRHRIDDGIWAGTTPKERRKLLKERKST